MTDQTSNSSSYYKGITHTLVALLLLAAFGGYSALITKQKI